MRCGVCCGAELLWGSIQILNKLRYFVMRDLAPLPRRVHSRTGCACNSPLDIHRTTPRHHSVERVLSESPSHGAAALANQTSRIVFLDRRILHGE